MTDYSDEEIVHFKKAFDSVVYEEQHVRYRMFDSCTFTKSNLKGCLFEHCKFENCTFDDCDLSLVKFRNTSFNRVTIKNSKAIGILWYTVNDPLDLYFENAKINFSSFWKKNLKKIRFMNCMAEEVDFSECNLVQADFTGTDLMNAKFFQTDLSQANFVGAANYLIDPQVNKLKKAKFSLPEALSFLSVLGITIVE